MNKRVSIILPCFNQEKNVAESIVSALNQTYKNIEIIIVNDGSTDTSNDIIKAFSDKYENILYIDNIDNKGLIYSRNIAIEHCTGEYILPLDADDVIEPTYVEKAVKILNKNQNIGIVYCKARFFGYKNGEWKLPPFDKNKILFSNCIFNSALFRKSDFLKAGKYKEYMKNGYEDWDLWLSFIELGLDAYRINEVLFNYRQYKNDCNRTACCSNNINDVLFNLGYHHAELYFKNKECQRRLYDSNIIKYANKYKKYKKLFNNFLLGFIVEAILLISLLIKFIIENIHC